MRTLGSSGINYVLDTDQIGIRIGLEMDATSSMERITLCKLYVHICRESVCFLRVNESMSKGTTGFGRDESQRWDGGVHQNDSRPAKGSANSDSAMVFNANRDEKPCRHVLGHVP